jgi:hypothetical protein
MLNVRASVLAQTPPFKCEDLDTAGSSMNFVRIGRGDRCWSDMVLAENEEGMGDALTACASQGLASCQDLYHPGATQTQSHHLLDPASIR